MKNKKNIVLSICLVILIIFAIVIIILKLFYEKFSVERLLESKIEQINYLNLALNDDNNFEDSYNHYLMENVGCKEYIGADKNKIFNILNNVYTDPFNSSSLLNVKEDETDPVMFDIINSLNGDIIYNYSVFNYITNDDGVVLYVCMPESWEFEEITNWEIVHEYDDEKVVKIGNSKISFLKSDGDWKFTIPVFLRK